MGDLGDYWRDAKKARKAAERRVGHTYCLCSAKVWNNSPHCVRCLRPNSDYKPPKAKAPA